MRNYNFGMFLRLKLSSGLVAGAAVSGPVGALRLPERSCHVTFVTGDG